MVPPGIKVCESMTKADAELAEKVEPKAVSCGAGVACCGAEVGAAASIWVVLPTTI